MTGTIFNTPTFTIPATAPRSIDKAALEDFKSATGQKYAYLRDKLLAYVSVLLDDIEKDLQWKNCPNIAFSAHRLKSCSGQIGATHLYSLVIEIEKLALKADVARIAPVLQAARDEYAKVTDELKEEVTRV